MRKSEGHSAESAMARYGDWIETFTGRKFYVLDPRPEDIDILDIAHALACLNRFTGHASEPMSIAQHSCNVCHLLPDELKLWGLMHDAAEAYLNDMSRPLKYMDEMASYRAAEKKMMAVICERFGLKAGKPEAVTLADNVMLKAEAKVLLSCRTETWGKWIADVPDLPAGSTVHIRPTWRWDEAESRFLDLFEKLTKEAA